MSHYSQLFWDNSLIAVPLSGPSADGKRGCRSRRYSTGKAISCWGLNRQCRIHEFHCIKSLLHVPGCLSPWKRVSPIQRARPCYERSKTFYSLSRTLGNTYFHSMIRPSTLSVVARTLKQEQACRKNLINLRPSPQHLEHQLTIARMVSRCSP
jgi:hypothetical protein